MEIQIKTTVKSITLSPEPLKPNRQTVPQDGEAMQEPQLSYFPGNSVKYWATTTHTPEK